MYPVRSFRLFIGIQFDEQTIHALVKRQQYIMQLSQSGNFTFRKNMHLTLEFIGNCSQNDIRLLIGILQTITVSPFPLTITRVGKFSQNRASTWWAGVESKKTLTFVQRTVHEQLNEHKFHIDTRKFFPHITLGRNIHMNQNAERTLLDTAWQPVSINVNAIHLMESTHVEGILTYRSLYKHSLLCTRYKD
jgi:2'-5' RNA ligase